jgi:hypothetical protein
MALAVVRIEDHEQWAALGRKRPRDPRGSLLRSAVRKHEFDARMRLHLQHIVGDVDADHFAPGAR